MRPHLTYANTASTLALVVALSGTAYAAATIGGAQVKDGSLTGRDVRDQSITSRDVRGLAKADLRPGVLPTPGPGARMEASGPLTVPAGPDNSFEMDVEAYDTGEMYSAPDDFLTITRAGTYLVTGKIQLDGAAVQRQVRVVVDETDIVEMSLDSGGDTRRTGQVTTLVRLDVGQTVRLGTFASNAIGVADFNSTNDAWLAVQWLAP